MAFPDPPSHLPSQPLAELGCPLLARATKYGTKTTSSSTYLFPTSFSNTAATATTCAGYHSPGAYRATGTRSVSPEVSGPPEGRNSLSFVSPQKPTLPFAPPVQPCTHLMTHTCLALPASGSLHLLFPPSGRPFPQLFIGPAPSLHLGACSRATSCTKA